MKTFFKIWLAASTIWLAGMLAVVAIIALLLSLLSGCSTPPYSATTAAPPTKGKALEAYNMGQSDAVKRQYWIARSLQEGKRNREEVLYKTRFYTFNIAPDPQANINKVPYDITVPIVE